MLPAQVHRNIYLVLITLLGGCMVTSTWASNLVWVLLGLNWLLEGRWCEKWQMARESLLLQAVLTLCALYVVGMLWTSNLAQGLRVLQVKLPLLVVPLVVLTTRPIVGRARKIAFMVYSLAVLVVTVIATVRVFTIPDLPYRDAVPYISHIRFALNCCMVIYLLVGMVKRSRKRVLRTVVLVAMIAWLLVFLVIIRSYTAVAVLAVVSLVVMLAYFRRWPLVALWLLLVGTAAVMVVIEAKSYYRMIPQATAPLQAYTAGYRPYSHARDGIIENGNYINNYVCTEELRTEWQRRSDVPFDSLGDEGFSVEPTLVRYLNALGLTKDSVGVNALTDGQIHDIECGVANPVYESHNPVRKMVYVMLFEREFYVHTHAVRGFSLLQRFELWQATVNVIRYNRWIGVGTGDVDDALHAELRNMNSELADTSKRSHNQYLSLMAAFGVVGAVLLLVMFLRPLVRRATKPSPLMVAWMLTVLISFLTEDTLDTLAGILFCTFFLAFSKQQCTNTTL
jgi:O-antigen ligase